MSLSSPSALHRLVVGLFQFLLRGKVLALVTVMICAYFAARTVSSLVEAEVLLPTANAATPPVKRPAPPSLKPTANPNVISDRNIFCSTCEPDVSYSGYQGQPAVLIATSVADSGRRATLRVVPTDVQGSWGLDETIPGVGKITRIGGTSIDVVDDGNHQKTISLLDGAVKPEDLKDPSKESKAADPFASRVRKINDTTYEVDRSVVSELMASAGQGAGAQAMPVLDKGEVKGLRLLRVKPTSVAAAIGLKSNDILSAIDNEPIKTMQGVLDAIAKVDNVKQLALQGTRAGKPLELTLKFR